jgi:hypothetical protein
VADLWWEQDGEGPTEVVDAAGEGAKLSLERAVAVVAPDADAS